MTAKEVFQSIIANNPTDIKTNLVSAGLVKPDFVVTEQNVYDLFAGMNSFQSTEQFGQFAGNMLGVRVNQYGPHGQELLYFANQFGGDIRSAIANSMIREAKMQQMNTSIASPLGNTPSLQSNNWLSTDKYKQEFEQMYHSFLSAHWLVKVLSLIGAIIVMTFIIKKINNNISL